MWATRRGLLLVLLLFGACSRSARPNRNGPGASPHPSASTSAPPVPAGPLVVRSEKVPGGIATVIENQTGAPVSLKRSILVEKQDGAAWTKVDAEMLYLRETCD